MLSNKTQRRPDNFAGAGIIVEDIKAVLAGWMIHERNGDVAFIRNVQDILTHNNLFHTRKLIHDPRLFYFPDISYMLYSSFS